MLAVSQVVTDPAAWGAFLTGAAAVLASWRSFKRIKRMDKDQCDERIAELERAHREGFERGLRVEPRPRRRAS